MVNLSNEITSNAFNFGNLYRTGVDPRTGTFNLSLTIGNLKTYGGEIFSATIGYNSLSDSNTGFGKGWSLNVSYYDKQSKKLSLSNGMSFPVNISGNSVTCRYLKDKDIVVSLKGGLLFINHKNGTTEQFNIEGGIEQITYVNGHFHKFHYKRGILSKISNSTGKEIVFLYTLNSFEVKNIFGESLCQGTISNGSLVKVSLPEHQLIGIKYKNISGLSMISEVKHPVGYSDIVDYYPEELKLPTSGPIRALPAVSLHKKVGNDEIKFKRYEYSSNNYLGNNLPIFRDGIDALYELNGNYEYSCTEFDELLEKTTVYDKYHLVIRQTIREKSSNKPINKKEYVYYTISNVDFSKQPNQFQNLRLNKEYFYNEVGEVRISEIATEFDTYGNLTMQKDNFGIEKYFTYYQKQDLALTDNDFYIPHLIKEEITAPSKKYIRNNEENYILTHQYEKLNCLFNKGQFFLLSRQDYKTNDGQILLSTSYQYCNDVNDVLFFGLVKTVNYSGVTKKKLESYRYTNNGNTIKVDVDSLFFDDILMSNSLIYCSEKINKLSEIDHLGNVITYKYDLLDRLIRKTFNQNSDYQYISEYVYSIDNKTLKNINNGLVFEKINYDDFGREKNIYKISADGDLCLSEVFDYDIYDRVIKVTYSDFINGKILSQFVRTVFDLWGKTTEINENGVETIIEIDNVNMTTTSYVSYSGIRYNELVVKSNEAGSEESSTYNSITSYSIYDGYNRLITSINRNGVQTTRNLDVFGRELKKVIGSGEKAITMSSSYDINSTDESVTEIRVNDIIIGKRTYDGIGRITSEKKVGGIVTFEFNTLTDIPSKVTKPSGSFVENLIDIKLEKVLGERTSSGNSINIFTYKKNTGLLINENNEYFSTDIEYYPNYLVKTDSQHGKYGKYTYSSSGLLTSYTDYFGGIETREYDKFNQLTEVSNDGVLVLLDYDYFGRLKSETISSKMSNDGTVTHEYYYSDKHFNKIESKITLRNSIMFMIQRYSYDNVGNLVYKEIIDENNQSYEEHYTFNTFNQMVGYQVVGLTRPSFNGVGHILNQEFIFDALSNINHVNTIFTDISGNEQLDNSEHIYNDDFLLVEIRHSNPLLENEHFEYDLNGNLLVNVDNQMLNYDDFERLTSVTSKEQIILSSYLYSASGRLTKQTFDNQPPINLFYFSEQLIHEEQNTYHSRALIVNGNQLGRFLIAEGTQLELSVTDYKNSQIGLISDINRKYIQYSAYGSTDDI
ncbi:hypothetical protein [Aliivibrio sifiae]|uniref:Sugar-binding protein n=1 Tax=Aliivibrio sifiae TaxID=566293 RepID=A0A2S7X2J6_9GAMM|nr:hypothetical protein [Aliivibrio sifiae]PQJ84229.1 hypothetical protein BTO22_11790 [Aliivibrio sifiae]